MHARGDGLLTDRILCVYIGFLREGFSLEVRNVLYGLNRELVLREMCGWSVWFSLSFSLSFFLLPSSPCFFLVCIEIDGKV